MLKKILILITQEKQWEILKKQPWFDFCTTVNLGKRRWPLCKKFFLVFSQRQPRKNEVRSGQTAKRKQKQ